MSSIYWLIAFVILVGIEVATMALTTIWFAGGALVAFLLSLFGLSVEVQLIAFVAVSFLLSVFYQTVCFQIHQQRYGKDQCRGAYWPGGAGYFRD